MSGVHPLSRGGNNYMRIRKQCEGFYYNAMILVPPKLIRQIDVILGQLMTRTNFFRVYSKYRLVKLNGESHDMCPSARRRVKPLAAFTGILTTKHNHAAGLNLRTQAKLTPPVGTLAEHVG